MNSCDSFEDCWPPFFALLDRNWPGLAAPILLNTEKKVWAGTGGRVISTQVQGIGEGRLTWSECLIRALGRVSTPLVLYMQEDYFLHAPVLESQVEAACELMLRQPEIGHIALSRHGSIGKHKPHECGWLEVVDPRARYRISTQAGLWRVATLLKYLRSEENGWMFEILGTLRSWRRNDIFLTVNQSPATRVPFEYIHTGIIKGRWHPQLPQVFERFGICVDFERRGFYRSKPALLRRLETARLILSHPRLVARALFD